VTSPESRSSGRRAGHADYESFPLVLPGPLTLGVEDQVPVDRVGDLALQGADGVLLGLARGHLLLQVDPTLGLGLTDLADSHHVDGVVELPVPAPG